MSISHIRKPLLSILLSVGIATVAALAQTQPAPTAPTHANILRGEYGRYRANNDLLSYDLDIRIDPEKKFVSGKNTIRFRMLKDDTRIQLDLYDNLNIYEIVFEPKGDFASSDSRDATTKHFVPTLL